MDRHTNSARERGASSPAVMLVRRSPVGGVVRVPVVFAMPSWEYVLLPQARTPPLTVNATV